MDGGKSRTLQRKVLRSGCQSEVRSEAQNEGFITIDRDCGVPDCKSRFKMKFTVFVEL